VKKVLKLPGFQPAHSVHGGVGFGGRRTVHAVNERCKQVETVDESGRNCHKEQVAEALGEPTGNHSWNGFHQVVQDDSGQHAGEEQGREVVVEVEDTAHAPEWHVVQQPADVQPSASVKRPPLQFCATKKIRNELKAK
jgi:hypothetical protein